MAIYWVDPYIGSANGPIHGTSDTTTRNGTYSSPWSLVDLTVSGKTSGLTNGDEVRFKGLAESTFFPTAASFISPTYTTTTSYYQLQAADAYKLIRVKDSRGVIYYTKPYGTSMYTGYGSSYWQAGCGLQDSTYGYYPFNTNYSITTGPGANVAMFSGLASSITVTSGWTSSTTRDGITVIDVMSTTPYGTTMYFGTNSTTTGKYVTWDCPEMIITVYYSMYFYIYANSIKLKAFASEYQPGYYAYFYVGASSAPYYSGSGNLNIGSLIYGGYIYIYGYPGNTTTPEINIPLISSGYYYPYIYIYKQSNTSYNVKLKHVYGFMPLQISDQTGSGNILNLYMDTDWAIENRYSPGPLFISNSFTVNENYASSQYTTPMFSGTTFNQFSYLASPSSNLSAPNATNTYYANSTSKLKKVVFGNGYRSFAKNLVIETGESLETLTVCPAASSTASAYGSPIKVQVMSETSSGKKVQFMAPTSAGDCALVYNNSNHSDKLCWKLFGTGNGKVYADTFSLPLVSFGANGATFNASFTTTATPGITLLVKLYGINKTTGVVTNIKNATTTVNGTAITATASFTNTELTTTYNVGSMFAIVDITKTSTATCDVIFNSMSLTSP